MFILGNYAKYFFSFDIWKEDSKVAFWTKMQAFRKYRVGRFSSVANLLLIIQIINGKWQTVSKYKLMNLIHLLSVVKVYTKRKDHAPNQHEILASKKIINGV